MNYGIGNVKAKSGGGGHKVILVYTGVINQDTTYDDVYVISQSDIDDNVVDIATGQPPTSYNQGDIILEIGYNNEYDYIMNLYGFNSISDGTWIGQNGDILLDHYTYINNGVKAKQLYQHNIHLILSTTEILMSVITSSSTPMNATAFKTYMQNVTNWVMCTGLGGGAIIWAIKNENSSTFRYMKGTTISDPIGWINITDATITDFVLAL